jgi:hypothetical protein
LLLNHGLEGVLDRVQRIEGQDATWHVGQRADQLLDGGDLFAFRVSEDLIEKRGEPS